MLVNFNKCPLTEIWEIIWAKLLTVKSATWLMLELECHVIYTNMDLKEVSQV